jgi:hypothetical protein
VIRMESGVSFELLIELGESVPSRAARHDMTHPDLASLFGTQPHVPPASSGAYPARPGNLVRPLVDGVPAFRRMAEAIDPASHSV